MHRGAGADVQGAGGSGFVGGAAGVGGDGVQPSGPDVDAGVDDVCQLHCLLPTTVAWLCRDCFDTAANRL